MGGGPMAESARLSPPPEPFDRRCTNNRQVMDIADLRQQLRQARTQDAIHALLVQSATPSAA